MIYYTYLHASRPIYKVGTRLRVKYMYLLLAQQTLYTYVNISSEI